MNPKNRFLFLPSEVKNHKFGSKHTENIIPLKFEEIKENKMDKSQFITGTDKNSLLISNNSNIKKDYEQNSVIIPLDLLSANQILQNKNFKNNLKSCNKKFNVIPNIALVCICLLLYYMVSYNILHTQIKPLIQQIQDHDKMHLEPKLTKQNPFIDLKRDVKKSDYIVISSHLFEKNSKSNSTGFIVDRGKMTIELNIFLEINANFRNNMLQIDCCCVCEGYLICESHKLHCILKFKDDTVGSSLNISFEKIYNGVSDCLLIL